jgi:cell division protein FtsW
MKKYSFALFFFAAITMALGLIFLLSASSVYSVQIRSNMFSIFFGQFIKAIGGIFLMIIFASIPYQRYKDFSKILMFLIIVVLILTITVMPQVAKVKRWFTIGPISFQPAEIAKLILIVHLAKLLEEKSEVLHDFREGLRYPLFWIFVTTLLVVAQKSVSNSVIILSTSLIMLFVAGANWKHLFSGIVGIGVPVFSFMMLFQHSRSRIIAFFGDGSLQLKQALISLGSGGIFGLGFGNSKQRNLHLPEAYGDFIFSIVGEETGLVGALVTILLFVAIFVIGMIIAKNAKDKFGQFLGFGIAVSFLLHAVIHVCVSTGMMPTTGIPLPLYSYGGTSLLVICASIGILMNIGFSTINETENKVELKTA